MNIKASFIRAIAPGIALSICLLASPSANAAYDPNNELHLKQTRHKQSFTDFTIETNNFDTFIKIPVLPAGIHYNAVLKTSLMAMRDHMQNPGLSKGSYFSGFTAYYGYDAMAQKLLLFFKPVCTNTIITNPNDDSVRYDLFEPNDILTPVHGDIPIYQANAHGDGDGDLTLIDVGTAATFINAYRNTVRFRTDDAPDGDSTRGFYDAPAYNGVFFSFQEVDSLLKYAATTLYFTHRAHQRLTGTGYAFRHTLSITGDMPMPHAQIPNHNVADLASGYPPGYVMGLESELVESSSFWTTLKAAGLGIAAFILGGGVVVAAFGKRLFGKRSRNATPPHRPTPPSVG